MGYPNYSLPKQSYQATVSSPRSPESPDSESEKWILSRLAIPNSKSFDGIVSVKSKSEQPRGKKRPRFLSAVYSRRILLLLGLVTVPMIALTIVTIWLIFGNRIASHQCPYEELCYTPDALNQTHPSSYYIVDFPAARLVFIASWTSSLSLTLLGPMMAIFAYAAAGSWLGQSKPSQPDANLPTPYQAGLLLRILNAELLTMWEMSVKKLQEIFWKKASSGVKPSTTPKIIRYSAAALATGIIASLMIQAADTYVHITTKAVNWVTIVPHNDTQQVYSHGLVPSCVNRKTFGSISNPNYWGCSIFMGVTEFNGTQSFSTKRGDWSSAMALNQDIYPDARVLDFHEKNVTHTAILGSRVSNPNIDWSASTYGVSTQCRALTPSDCNITEAVDLNVAGSSARASNFSCSGVRPNAVVSGLIHPVSPLVSFLNFHKTLHENKTFRVGATINDFNLSAAALEAASLSDEDSADTFANPWDWMAMMQVVVPLKDKEVWYSETNDYYFMLMHCQSTVWDLEYTVMNEKVAKVKRVKSNSTVTGTSSMPVAPMFGMQNTWFTAMEQYTYFGSDSVDEILTKYQEEASRKFVLPFAAQTEKRPAHKVQRRDTRLVSKVPKAAVWTLIIANVFFILLTLGMAGVALYTTTDEVHQVQTRMGIMGLCAQAFEHLTSKRAVREEKDLFEERGGEKNRMVKRVGFERTREGGATYSLSERWEG